MGLYSRYILPRVLEFGMTRPMIMRERGPALAEASGEVLEIGYGTGLNFACYPSSVTGLTVIDPAEMLPRRVAQRIKRSGLPIHVERGDAATLPFDAARFDCVTSTWTLCTIPAFEEALAEIRRVLKPSGRFLFLEHGRSQDERLVRWQDRLDRLHSLLSGGCHVNRPIDRLVTAAGFALARLDRFEMPHVPRYQAAHYRGIATVA